MKSKHFIRPLIALGAVTALSSTALMAAEYANPAAGFASTMTRADVSSELRDAKVNGTAASKRIDGDEDSGARGPVGSRYSGATRGEVNDQLIAHRRDHAANAPATPNSLYFGD